MHSLEFTQFLPVDIHTAWKFFSSPSNLQKITPPEMGFVIHTDLPVEMYPGLVIQYTVRPLLGIPLSWVTEITQVQKPYYFVDTQLSGPYAVWHHQHHFREVEGGIEMKDILHYKLPLGILGQLVNYLFIGKKVKGIFEYREKILKDLYDQNN